MLCSTIISVAIISSSGISKQRKTWEQVCDVRYTYSHYLWQLFSLFLLLCRNAKISQLVFGSECPEMAQCQLTAWALPQIWFRHHWGSLYNPSFSSSVCLPIQGNQLSKERKTASLQNANQCLIAVKSLPWRPIFSLCVSAVSGNASDRNQGGQVFSVCPGSALAMGLTGNHCHYPAVACLWLANLPATFIRLLKEVDVEDKESLGIQLPAEKMLSKLPACA